MKKQLTESQIKHLEKTGSEFEKTVLTLLFGFGVIMDNNQKAQAAKKISEIVRDRISEIETLALGDIMQ
jgi:hypothetical protein